MRSERAAAARHSQSAARPPGENNRARGGLRAGRDRTGPERGAAAPGSRRGEPAAALSGSPGGSARGRVRVPLPPRMLFFLSRTATVESVGV